MIGTFSVLDYSVPAFTHIWMLWLVLIDSLYYFIGILFTLPQRQKRANSLTLQAEEPLCHREAVWLLDKKQWHSLCKATLDMNRAIIRNCSKSFVFNGKSPLINLENLSSLPLNRTAVAEVSQISGFF